MPQPYAWGVTVKADLRPIVREKIADSLKAGKRDAERRPHHHLTREDDGVEYVTRYERFILGDFPMVCARSGLPATKLVPVEATPDQFIAGGIAIGLLLEVLLGEESVICP